MTKSDSNSGQQCRIAWKSRVTGASGNGDWKPIAQKKSLELYAKDQNKEYKNQLEHKVETR